MSPINNIIIVGFGSIAQALLPLLIEHYNANITIFDKEVDKTRQDIATEFSATLHKKHITNNNFIEVLSPLLSSTRFLLNLAVSVSSTALIGLTQRFKTLYLDTCIEPWEYGNQKDHSLTSNYDLRKELKNTHMD
ncbi:Saccharopine dehydrogenase NADP binding domain-containing protein [Pseudomonas sp. ok272]|uniref:saccharopine dehydrogenase NADP-binding domain-containing protein n=1 Tax=unclassified Pseudomonas TaxID=196821 RepID=UPI0008D344FA|nr:MULTISPECIES: saccharopine dehydrogenase NADP-binding domain-containing protein [unclassified Pseudomonas]SEM33791.1 Saccharopine dehydrogenase NADP binding domain-containing protein [Pseudomonas sp. ok272]SFM33739.1 Saccharopine dehydrogenase NADP binding domain-containing protein [Pseudomonas sp. ok602]